MEILNNDLNNEPPPISDVNDLQWFYELKQQRIGPVTQTAIENLINQNTLNGDSIVWRKGYTEWKPIKQSELGIINNVPPPLTGSKVSNTAVWIIAFVPIWGIIFKNIFFPDAMPIIYWVCLNTVLIIWDAQMTSRAGYKNNILWGLFFIPIYLWKRAAMTKQSKAYFWVWIVAFFISTSTGFMEGIRKGIDESNNTSIQQNKKISLLT